MCSHTGAALCMISTLSGSMQTATDWKRDHKTQRSMLPHRCRTLYEKYLEWQPANCHGWTKFADLEKSLGEAQRTRAIYELAISQPVSVLGVLGCSCARGCRCVCVHWAHARICLLCPIPLKDKLKRKYYTQLLRLRLCLSPSQK